jgi:NAD(P)-dependent dehydrogenase (short-subunit alcohol dehydrogenase family)
MRFEGRRVLVTGASRGIGRGIVDAFLEEGATVFASDVLEAGLRRVAGGHPAADRLHTFAADLADPDAAAGVVPAAVDALGGLDVLVNNAGIIETSLTDQCAVDTLPEEVWDAVYEVNLRAVWLATKFAAPHLRRSTRGPNIVNAASVSGLTGFPLGPIYCTSKGGVVQLTKVTAVDLAPTVRCNCFCPGVIATPLARGHVEAAEDPDAAMRKLVAPQLVDRLGTPEEVAKLACFLASDDAAFITGGVYPVDGGALAWIGTR